MKINLEDAIDDELEGKWYHYVRSTDFAWLSRIPDQSALDVNDDDLIIHKELEEGERWPKVKYHQILDGEAFEVDGNDARELLAEKMIAYINKNNKLPYACEFVQVFKNGNIKMKYVPADMDFVLKIPKKDVQNITMLQDETDPDAIEKYLIELDTGENDLEKGSATKKIQNLRSAPVIESIALESGKNKVFVYDAEIINIDLRKSFYMGNESIFYLIETRGGTAAPDNKKETLQRNIEKTIVKCSENAMEKYKLEVGQKITFNSTFKEDKKLGILLQNVRKFTTST